MPRPVINWPLVSANTPLFADLDNPNLIHFGPIATWDALDSRAIGNKATVLHGEIDLQVTSAELMRLQGVFPGKQFAPLVAQDVTGNLSVKIETTYHHNIVATLIPSFPFPKVSFNATIYTDDPLHSSLISEISQKWLDKNLISGGLVLSYSMVSCNFSAQILIDTSLALQEISGSMSNHGWSKISLLKGISKAIDKNSSIWIANRSPLQGQIKNLIEIQDYLTQQLFTALAREVGDVLVFDNGDRLEKFELIDKTQLSKTLSWRTTSSESIINEMIFFSES
ncbi:hypothetical protein [Pseudomonas sp. BR20]|uniref:hypothetical protein n=1 Tax=Pseudomonas sp. BR20 TaxID=3137452 RepID=UPI003D701C13